MKNKNLLFCASCAFCAFCALLLAPGCVALAPVSIAWRSNSSVQHATTEGTTDLKTESPTVNAEKTSATDLKVAKEISTQDDTVTTGEGK
jgi:hypothetical protein